MALSLSPELKHNPAGFLIAIVLFMILVYYLSSLSGFSPITNSTIANQLGCASCGPGGSAAGAYNVLQPFTVAFFAAGPALLLYGYVLHQQDRRKRVVIPPVDMSLEFEEE